MRITDAIRADHQQLQSYYDQILHAPDEDEQTRYQNQLVWELARHIVGEDLVVYPALEQTTRDGARDRQTIKEQLAIFQDLHCSDPRFLPSMTLLMDQLAAHVHMEETVDLVKLEGAVTSEESARLARSFGRTKHFVPTRAHPSAPDRPPYQTPVALLTAPLDSLQDLFRRWPESEFSPQPPME
ncbi:hypothetical protein N7492_003160 [Penicillium capsulatum]|uniref:Hemerythrin-like domain-containing protein n=1 Tax=Penicillium capsulatum TaxID=69766 RepID=A0A9W9LWC2_9EURO|nr:hypothetical protein N7492_003160 [Penicillium capsulatum]KAJ6122250.1 hypothetical protein N7512_004715 [Penicillium capsulatum]